MAPQIVVSPNDVQKVWRAAQAIGNPLSLAGRFAGLGEVEQQAGVPAWSWVALAFLVGGVVGMQVGPRLHDFLRRR